MGDVTLIFQFLQARQEMIDKDRDRRFVFIEGSLLLVCQLCDRTVQKQPERC